MNGMNYWDRNSKVFCLVFLGAGELDALVRTFCDLNLLDLFALTFLICGIVGGTLSESAIVSDFCFFDDLYIFTVRVVDW